MIGEMAAHAAFTEQSGFGQAREHVLQKRLA